MTGETFIQSARFRQTAVLYAAILFNTALGFVAAKLNTHYLNVDDFGRLNFFIITLTFAHHFFSLGVFESASRRLALETSRRKIREMSGAVLLFTLLSGLVFVLFIFIWSFFSDRFFEVPVGSFLRLYAPLAFVLIWQTMLLILLRGMGDIRGLSWFTFSPRLLYVSGLTGLAVFAAFSLRHTMLLFLLSILLASLVFIIRLRPLFGRIKENLSVLREETRSYGRHVYVANLVSAVIMHADKFFLAYFLDSRQLGYYTLAFMLSVPLLHFATAVSRSHYHEFANSPHIQAATLKTNLIFQIAGVAALMLLGKPIILYIFSATYLPGLKALYILAAAFALSGLAMPYTSFLKAHGRGKTIRNITIQVQTVLIIFSVIFIPLWGINGAALAVLAANAYDLTAYVKQYRKLVKSNPV